MAPAILALLEQEHPPAARYLLQHEYNRAHGPRGYNPYLVIPQNERDRLMMQSVEDGQVNLAKYGQLLEEAALKHQLAHTRSKNVPLVMKPPADENRSVDLSELQAKLRKLEEDHLGVPDEMSERPPARPGTWTEEDQLQGRRCCHGVAVEASAYSEDPETTKTAETKIQDGNYSGIVGAYRQ